MNKIFFLFHKEDRLKAKQNEKKERKEEAYKEFVSVGFSNLKLKRNMNTQTISAYKMTFSEREFSNK